MKTISTTIYEAWLNSIERGARKVERRDMTDHWIDRLVDKAKYPDMSNDEIRDNLFHGGKFYPIHYDAITLMCNQRSVTMEIKKIVVLKHHTTFAFHLGGRIKDKNHE